jgi:hypothetical protein
MACAYITYPDLVGNGKRLAKLEWEHCSFEQAVAASIKWDPFAVVLAVSDSYEWIKGFAPGGICPINLVRPTAYPDGWVEDISTGGSNG